MGCWWRSSHNPPQTRRPWGLRERLGCAPGHTCKVLAFARLLACFPWVCSMVTLNVVSLYLVLSSPATWYLALDTALMDRTSVTHVAHITVGFVYKNCLIYEVMEFVLECGNQGLYNHTALSNLHTRSFTSCLRSTGAFHSWVFVFQLSRRTCQLCRLCTSHHTLQKKSHPFAFPKL